MMFEVRAWFKLGITFLKLVKMRFVQFITKLNRRGNITITLRNTHRKGEPGIIVVQGDNNENIKIFKG